MAGVTRWDPFQELLLIEDDVPARPVAGEPDPQDRDGPAPDQAPAE